MKTLYINIKGDIIPSDDNLIVVGRPEDAIVNKFFFELGKEILKGVVVPGVTSIKKKDIVTAFKTHDEKSFYRILDQWDTLKQELLGENPSGSRTVKLPDEYISWLQNSSQPVYAEIAKSLYKRGSCVEVSLDKIYKNAIGIIVNNIEPEECKDCAQFVVNDDAVTDDSAITGSIQERVPQIAFVPFEDFEWPKEKTIEEKYVKKDNEEKHKGNFEGSRLFPIFGITLGEKSVRDIKNKDKITEEENFQIYAPENSAFVFIQSPLYRFFNIATAINEKDGIPFPKQWADIMGLRWGLSFNNCQAALRSREFKIRLKRKGCYEELNREYVDYICAESPDGAHFVELEFQDKKLNLVLVSLKKCPNCGKNEIWVDANGNFPFPLRCKNKDCGYTWTNLPRENDDYSDYDDDECDEYDEDAPECPKCGSHDIYRSNRNYDICYCNDCGKRFEWDD